MLAVPYRAELRSRAIDAASAVVLASAVAVGLIALAGRIDDLNLRWFDAAILAVAVFLAGALYSNRRWRLGEQLSRPRPLSADVEQAAPARVPWLKTAARGLAGGLLVGGFALIVDLETDNLAVVAAVALGGIFGSDAASAVTLTRYEREHGGTVYRLEDPPGTEAGLGWLPGRGQ